jgi:Ca2+-binding EF-hand superfamily protein
MKTPILVACFVTSLYGCASNQTVIPYDFEQLDSDVDGYLSHEEASLRKDLEKEWATVDKDHDGKLDYSEFSAFEARGRYEPPHGLHEPGTSAY